MTPVRKVLAPALALYAALFAFAFVASPYSCEWGLSAYFFAGLAILLALAAAPFALAPTSASRGARSWRPSSSPRASGSGSPA